MEQLSYETFFLISHIFLTTAPFIITNKNQTTEEMLELSCSFLYYKIFFANFSVNY